MVGLPIKDQFELIDELFSNIISFNLLLHPKTKENERKYVILFLGHCHESKQPDFLWKKYDVVSKYFDPIRI